MVIAMDYDINLESLKQKNNSFQELNNEVINLKNSFSSSYINNLSGSEISNITNQLSDNINRLWAAYNNCEQWLQGYCQDLESLENSLASFSDTNITTLLDFKGEFTNLFSKITIPTLKTGGNKEALIWQTIQENTQNIDTETIFNNIPDNLSNNKVPYYSQNDSRWNKLKFGGGNIGSSGCSVASISMVMSYLKNDEITPKDIYQSIMENNNNNPKAFYISGVGASWDIFPSVGSYYNVNCNQISADSVVEAVKNGNPVIMSAKPGDFPVGKGHFIVITGITPSGKLTVNDPNASHKNYSNQEWDIQRVLSQGKGFWEYSN